MSVDAMSANATTVHPLLGFELYPEHVAVIHTFVKWMIRENAHDQNGEALWVGIKSRMPAVANELFVFSSRQSEDKRFPHPVILNPRCTLFTHDDAEAIKLSFYGPDAYFNTSGVAAGHKYITGKEMRRRRLIMVNSLSAHKDVHFEIYPSDMTGIAALEKFTVNQYDSDGRPMWKGRYSHLPALFDKQTGKLATSKQLDGEGDDIIILNPFYRINPSDVKILQEMILEPDLHPRVFTHAIHDFKAVYERERQILLEVEGRLNPLVQFREGVVKLLGATQV